MAAKIVKTEKVSFPQMRLIGRVYEDGGNWGEWWENDLFSPLEKLGPLEEIENGYIGAMRVVDGKLEYWIGLFFPPGTEAPEGYRYADIEKKDYAVFYRYGNPENGELYGLEAHNACLEKLGEMGLVRSEDDWCWERYNCPRFTEPDEKGNVILDYGIAVL